MFHTLASVHHQIITRDRLSQPHRFWYILPDLPYGIQNAMAVFQLELECLVSREAPWPYGVILYGVGGTNTP